MAEIHLICASCRGVITHSCGANREPELAQSPPESGANGTANLAQSQDRAEIARSSLSSSSSSKRAYNRGYEQEFLTFWSAYPLKRDKRKAALAWRKSVLRLTQSSGANRRDAMAQILAGAVRYANDPNRSAQFTKYAEGWLNGDCWEDEPLPPKDDPKARWEAQVEAERQRKLAEARQIIEQGRNG